LWKRSRYRYNESPVVRPIFCAESFGEREILGIIGLSLPDPAGYMHGPSSIRDVLGKDRDE
jgi:hypothetical protein